MNVEKFLKGLFWYISSHTKLIQRGSEIDWLIGSALKWLDVFCCLWPLTWLSSQRGTVLASVDPICSVGVTAAAVHPHWGRRASHTHYRRHSTVCRAGSQNVSEIFMHMRPCNIQPRTTHMHIHRVLYTRTFSPNDKHAHILLNSYKRVSDTHVTHSPNSRMQYTHKNANVNTETFLLPFK